MTKSKWLPSKDSWWTFAFNSFLLLSTLLIGNYWISNKLNSITATRVEAQSLADKKIQFVSEFTKLGQSRIYLGENFYFNFISVTPESVLDDAWNRYSNAVIEWNSQNLFNPIFIEHYFGHDMRDRFEKQLNPKLIALHIMLDDLHQGKTRHDAKEVMENAKNEMYRFAEDLIASK